MLKNKQFNLYSGFEKAIVKDEEGIAYIEGWASKNYDDNGNPVVDYDSEIVQCEGFDLSRARTLLFAHDHSQPIGKIRLTHRPQGIWCEAEVHKAMDEKAYYGVKNDIITGFSIGFMATDYEYTDIGNKSYVTFTKGYVLENSLVSVGANPEALITSVKGLVSNKKVKGLQIEIDKEEELDQAEKQTIQDVIKGLTFEETEKEAYNEYQKLGYYFGILKETIDDNFFEALWSEDMTGDEIKANMLGALESFAAKIEELEVLKPVPSDEGVVQKEEREQIVKNAKVEKEQEEVKPTEPTEEVVETVAQEGDEEVEATDVVETTNETAEETPAEEQPEEQNSESLEDKEEDIVSEGESQEGEVSAGELPKLSPQSTVGYLNTLVYEELTAEEIEALYNTASDVLERIEAYVKQDLEEEA